MSSLRKHVLKFHGTHVYELTKKIRYKEMSEDIEPLFVFMLTNAVSYTYVMPYSVAIQYGKKGTVYFLMFAIFEYIFIVTEDLDVKRNFIKERNQLLTRNFTRGGLQPPPMGDSLEHVAPPINPCVNVASDLAITYGFASIGVYNNGRQTNPFGGSTTSNAFNLNEASYQEENVFQVDEVMRNSSTALYGNEIVPFSMEHFPVQDNHGSRYKGLRYNGNDDTFIDSENSFY